MKRIILNRTSYFHAPVLWMATSTRYGVSAYGRTVAEARQRLFITTNVHRRNCDAVVWGQLGIPFDLPPRV